jgi:hypothetical protein
MQENDLSAQYVNPGETNIAAIAIDMEAMEMNRKEFEIEMVYGLKFIIRLLSRRSIFCLNLLTGLLEKNITCMKIANKALTEI